VSHPRIHVEVKRGGQETRITVSGWPREQAAWAIYTLDQIPQQVSSPEWDPRDEAALSQRLGGGRVKGRVLEAVGFHNFDWNASVAAVLLHVESRKPLRITRMLVIDGLSGPDEQEVRVALLACAAEVALALKAKGVGNGRLDWEIPADQEGRLMRIYPDFTKAPASQQPRGNRSLLRRCPDKDSR
jgi:hypothetical protein